MRKAYSARCNFFADDSSLSNRINFYIVPPDRAVLDTPTVFFPHVHDQFGKLGSPFEQVGAGRNVRRFNDGFDRWGFPGTHYDGDPADFLGQSPKSKYYDGDTPPPPPCMGIEVFRVPLALRVIQLAFDPMTDANAVPLAMAFELWEPELLGIKFYAATLDEIEFVRVKLLPLNLFAGLADEAPIMKPATASLMIAMTASDPTPYVELLTIPLHLAAFSADSTPAGIVAAMALQLAGLSFTVYPPGFAFDEALQLAALSTDGTPPVEVLAVPVQVAAISFTAYPPDFAYAVPLQLAALVSEGTPTGEPAVVALQLAALSFVAYPPDFAYAVPLQLAALSADGTPAVEVRGVALHLAVTSYDPASIDHCIAAVQLAIAQFGDPTEVCFEPLHLFAVAYAPADVWKEPLHLFAVAYDPPDIWKEPLHLFAVAYDPPDICKEPLHLFAVAYDPPEVREVPLQLACEVSPLWFGCVNCSDGMWEFGTLTCTDAADGTESADGINTSFALIRSAACQLRSANFVPYTGGPNCFWRVTMRSTGCRIELAKVSGIGCPSFILPDVAGVGCVDDAVVNGFSWACPQWDLSAAVFTWHPGP